MWSASIAAKLDAKLRCGSCVPATSLAPLLGDLRVDLFRRQKWDPAGDDLLAQRPELATERGSRLELLRARSGARRCRRPSLSTSFPRLSLATLDLLAPVFFVAGYADRLSRAMQ